MREIIQKRLQNISDLDERRKLRTILTDVFETMVEYNEEMYRTLENRIYSEIEDTRGNFYIYSSLEHISNVDPISKFLYPMDLNDLHMDEQNMTLLAEQISTEDEVVLAQIFMKCSHLKIQEIIERAELYKGYIQTKENLHEVKISLKICTKYIKIIENLYQAFQLNGIEWNTIYCPYAYKFVDVVLHSKPSFHKDENIKEITVDLGEYEKYKVLNMIPMWNVKATEVQDNSFPVPAKDRIHYEHQISLSELGTEHGYMIGLHNEQFSYIKRYPEELIIVSDASEQKSWNLIQILHQDYEQKKSDYALVSNHRDLGFIGRFSSVRGMIIRTRGEIMRLIKSYDISDKFVFKDLKVIKESVYEGEQTMNFNHFIDDQIRLYTLKNILLLQFQPLITDDFLLYDHLSFLVSEIQMLFPEYRCVGELV